MDSLPPDTDTDRPSGYGAFWPGKTFERKFASDRGMRHERFEDYLFVRVRHLPTDATLALARAELGPAAEPALRAWRDLYDRSVPILSLFAEECGHVEPGERVGKRDAAHAGRVRDLLDDGHRHAAAAELAMGARMSVPVREAGMHVLEDAATMLALAEAGVPFRFCVHGTDEPRYMGFAPGEDCFRPVDEEEVEATRERARWQVGACNPDWSSPSFRLHARRGFALCAGFHILAATLLDMSRQGHAKAFLKHAIPKGGTWVVDIAGCEGMEDAARRLLGTIGLASADLFREDFPWKAMVVQEFLPFTHEHRFFCVGHRVVASTPSVRTLSLLDAGATILDPRVARLRVPAGAVGEYDRGEADAVHDRLLVAEMARGAREIARRLRDEGRYHGHYVIDMGLTERGVAAIEVNTFANAGLYAVDVRRIARSLARWYAEPARRPESGFVDAWGEAPTMSWMPVMQPPRGKGGAAGVLGRAKMVMNLLAGRPEPEAGPKPDDGDIGHDEQVAMLLRWTLNAVATAEKASGKGKDG